MVDFLLPFSAVAAASLSGLISWHRLRQLISAQEKIARRIREHLTKTEASSAKADNLANYQLTAIVRAELDEIALDQPLPESTALSDALVQAFKDLNAAEKGALMEKLQRETERAKDALAQRIVSRARSFAPDT
jgi:hypothetical protein